MAELLNTTLNSDANLLHYYRMEGNSNDTKNTDNGADTSMTYAAADGKFTQGAHFSGSGYISFSSKQTGNSPAFSVTFWTKTTQTSIEEIYNNNNGGASNKVGHEIYLNSNGKLHHNYTTSALTNSYSFDSVKSVNDGLFHHVVCVWDGTTGANSAKTYIDGALDNQATPTNATVNSSDNATVGATSTDHNTFFIGSIDDLAVFNRVLTAAEVLTLFQSGGNFFPFL